jgi:hypothetical protein
VEVSMLELPKERQRFALVAMFLFLLVGSVAAQSAQAQPRPPRPAAGPEVTAVSVRPLKTSAKPKPCPADPTLFGTIYTNGATDVKYTWVTSDGKSWPDKTVKVTSSKLAGVSTSWKLGKPGEKNVKAWIQLKVIDPNPMLSTKMSFEFHCE